MAWSCMLAGRTSTPRGPRRRCCRQPRTRGTKGTSRSSRMSTGPREGPRGAGGRARSPPGHGDASLDPGSRSRSQRPPRGSLPPSRSPACAREVTDRAGLTETTRTYGGTVADFDGNGWLDLFISATVTLLAASARVARSDVLPDEAPRRDRHGCAAADVDGDGRPDPAPWAAGEARASRPASCGSRRPMAA